MKIAWRKVVPNMTTRNAKKLALKMYASNCGGIILTKEPFEYLRILRTYGISASAKPILRDKKLVGYKFVQTF